MEATNKEAFFIKLDVAKAIPAAIKKVNTHIKNIHMLLVEVLFSDLNASLAILDFAICYLYSSFFTKILVAIHKVNFAA